MRSLGQMYIHAVLSPPLHPSHLSEITKDGMNYLLLHLDRWRICRLSAVSHPSSCPSAQSELDHRSVAQLYFFETKGRHPQGIVNLFFLWGGGVILQADSPANASIWQHPNSTMQRLYKGQPPKGYRQLRHSAANFSVEPNLSDHRLHM